MPGFQFCKSLSLSGLRTFKSEALGRLRTGITRLIPGCACSQTYAATVCVAHHALRSIGLPLITPAPEEQHSHRQQRTGYCNNPVDARADERHISSGEQDEGHSANSGPVPRQRNYPQNDGAWHEMYREILQRLCEWFAWLERVQGEETQEGAHGDSQDSRSPEEKCAGHGSVEDQPMSRPKS
jgi:hypothetical protein